MSHPMRVRGLKPELSNLRSYYINVAPHAGAWIETNEETEILGSLPCRTPCGCVD